jgi:molybdopterin-guanine dinucleotide biosynthesis protein A
MSFSAVILTGGKSSRMGCDKAFLEIGGQLLLARQIQLVRAAGAVEVFISGRADVDYSAFGCRVLQDQFPKAGPLAGIERGLDAASFPRLLVLAVDLPDMSAEFLHRLAGHASGKSGVIPRMCGNIEPLAAFYPKSALPLAVAQLTANRNAVKPFAERCVQASLANYFHVSQADARRFQNWNSPADFASARG